MGIIEDELWTHFKPLWQDFHATGKYFLVAGGYGLFLKQQWLLQQKNTAIVVPLERWLDATPRVTKDLDLVVGLDLIADDKSNLQLMATLEKHGFKVSERPQGKRWQFYKELGNERSIIIELHAQAPEEGAKNLKSDQVRVKHTPSLGDDGVHGRLNPEAVGGQIQPFSFTYDNTEVVVPNVVTWSVMKLTATEERWIKSQNPEYTAEERAFSRAQAIKHGHDVCRAVAMMSVEERDATSAVVPAIRDTPQYKRSISIYNDFFSGENEWANEILKDRWSQEDMTMIHTVLKTIFKL